MRESITRAFCYSFALSICLMIDHRDAKNSQIEPVLISHQQYHQ